MARAIWSGSISFGLLNVPVKLYSAVSKQTVRFKELSESDGSRVRHKRVSEKTGKEVPYERIVKGYEFAPDQYVILNKDEMAELDPKKSRAIEIKDFVDLDEIDPIYFEQPYYLGPDKGAEKAYSLLVKAMSDSGKVAVARFVLRNKEHLAAIRPMDGKVLTLATMRFHDEVSTPKDLELDDIKTEKPDAKELQMAKQLIESFTSDFDPQNYRDEYREELLNVLEQKAKGKEIVSAESEVPKPTKAPDLMAALEESLAAIKGEEYKSSGSSSSNGSSKSKRKSPAKKPAAKPASKKRAAAKRKARAGSK